LYCDKTKVGSSYDSYHPHNTNTAHIKNIKGVIRHLRKQYLPKGITFTKLYTLLGAVFFTNFKKMKDKIVYSVILANSKPCNKTHW